MNKSTMQGNWKEQRGEIKRQWGKLTEDDLTELEGNQQKLAGKLEKRYGMVKEEASRKANEFLAKLNRKVD